jgi:hypothetical protein
MKNLKTIYFSVCIILHKRRRALLWRRITRRRRVSFALGYFFSFHFYFSFFWLISSNTHTRFFFFFFSFTDVLWMSDGGYNQTNQDRERERESLSCLIFCTAPLWCCSHSFLFLSILSREIFSCIQHKNIHISSPSLVCCVKGRAQSKTSTCIGLTARRSHIFFSFSLESIWLWNHLLLLLLFLYIVVQGLFPCFFWRSGI